MNYIRARDTSIVNKVDTVRSTMFLGSETYTSPRWCSGRAAASSEGGRGFDRRPGHKKDFKHDSNGCPSWRSGLRG